MLNSYFESLEHLNGKVSSNILRAWNFAQQTPADWNDERHFWTRFIQIHCRICGSEKATYIFETVIVIKKNKITFDFLICPTEQIYKIISQIDFDNKKTSNNFYICTRFKHQLLLSFLIKNYCSFS